MKKDVWDILSKKTDNEIRVLELELGQYLLRCASLKEKISSVESYIQDYSGTLDPKIGESISLSQSLNTMAFVDQLLHAKTKLSAALEEFDLKAIVLRRELIELTIEGMKYKKIAERKVKEEREVLEIQERKTQEETFLTKFATHNS